MDLRRVGPGPVLLLLAIVALAPAVRAATLVVSTCQICGANGIGDCETGPQETGRGATTDMSRFWSSPDGFAFAASCAIATDFASLGGSVRGSGTHDPVNPGPFLNNIARSGRAFGTTIDRVTAGSGGASGFLRIPIHLVGSTVIEWQNGSGSASFGFSCQSYLPGSPTTLGACAPTNRNFTGTESFDQVVLVDLPILLGTEFEYSITFSATAGTGYAYGDVPPFSGQAQLDFATQAFSGAIVLDANKQPIPDAPISLGESGFDYAPEPSAVLAGGASVACLASLRRRTAR